MTNEKDIHQIQAELNELLRQMGQNAVQQLDTLAERQQSLGEFMVRIAETVVSLSERLSDLEKK